MRIYFMSIGGTGMGNAAILMRQLGHEVLGTDQEIYPPMSDALAAAGIEPLRGYDPERLKTLAPDVVVVGNVNTRGNPEIEWLLDTRRFPMVSLPGLLNEYLLRRRRNIVVCGTHGKTTTTALCAHLLAGSQTSPGYFIGGVPAGLPSGVQPGVDGGPFVIEGDEYDSAFFDKRSKFIHYAPNILVLNNLEFDHADIFRDVEDIARSFRHVMRLVPGSGAILANGDDPLLAPLLNISWTPILRVGVGPDNDLVIADFSDSTSGSSFDLIYRGKLWASINWPHWGLFNARNAAIAALAVTRLLGLENPCSFDLEKLSAFQGVKRRQEQLFDDGTLAILSDFAHHPTAIAGTLSGMRARFPNRQIIACFEARSNTACRNIHQDGFTEALALADRIHLGSIFRADRYSATDRINFKTMVERIGDRAIAHPSNAELGEAVAREIATSEPKVICFFSNGSFDGVIAQSVESTRAQKSVRSAVITPGS